jgi:hypothetical protein
MPTSHPANVPVDTETADRLLTLMREQQRLIEALSAENQRLRIENTRLLGIVIDELKVLGVAVRQQSREDQAVVDELNVTIVARPQPDWSTLPPQLPAALPAAAPDPEPEPAPPAQPSFAPRQCKRCGETFTPVSRYHRTCTDCRHLQYQARGFAMQRSMREQKEKTVDKVEQPA